MRDREVARQADLGNPITVFESHKGTGDGAAKVVGLCFLLHKILSPVRRYLAGSVLA